jgi:hypothetical protein
MREVPVVSNMISEIESAVYETAQQPLPSYGTGACLHVTGMTRTQPVHASASAQRPCSATTATRMAAGHLAALGAGASPAGASAFVAAVQKPNGAVDSAAALTGTALSDGQAAGPRYIGQQFAYMTQIATDGGVPGPHPAREPV